MSPPAPPSTTATPRDLPRLVMRRAAWVAAAVLVVAAALGLWRANQDIDDEVAAALHLASVVAGLADAATQDDAQALQRLRALRAGQGLRHLVLQVHGADGRLLLGPEGTQAGDDPAWLRGLLALHRRWLSAPEARRVSWALPRPGGAPWQVTLAASHDGERREALANLGGMLVLLLLCIAGLLVVMRRNLARAFRPLDQLVAAIAAISDIGRRDAQATPALPPMPISELEQIAAATRRLAASLDEAQRQRRQLGQKVLTLQEEERTRIARELHDELGQRLTAMRVDAAWLLRKLPADDPLRPVLQGLATQCEHIQQDVRQLLARLQPFGAATDEVESLARLLALLRTLVAGWRGMATQDTAFSLSLTAYDAAGRPAPWPEGDAAEALGLPSALALVLYRISQEALTNVARHAGAMHAELGLVLREAAAGRPAVIEWSVIDDGAGLADAAGALQRGNGLAGIHERVWALGSDLAAGPARSDPARPGLRLWARFEFEPRPAQAQAGA